MYVVRIHAYKHMYIHILIIIEVTIIIAFALLYFLGCFILTQAIAISTHELVWLGELERMAVMSSRPRYVDYLHKLNQHLSSALVHLSSYHLSPIFPK